MEVIAYVQVYGVTLNICWQEYYAKQHPNGYFQAPESVLSKLTWPQRKELELYQEILDKHGVDYTIAALEALREQA